MQHRRHSDHSPTVLRSFRLPQALDQRIALLSQKSVTTKSAWVIRVLSQQAFKHQKEVANANS